MNKTTHPNKETTLNNSDKENILKKMYAITEMGLFHTPESVEEIVNFIDTLPSNQRANAWTVYGLLNNLIVDRLRHGHVVVAGGE